MEWIARLLAASKHLPLLVTGYGANQATTALAGCLLLADISVASIYNQQ